MKTILVDMDEVIFFTHKRFNERLAETHPDITPVPYENSTSFYLEELYPQEQKTKIGAIWRQEGFFKSIPLMQGALEALNELKSRHEVWICSSPITSPYCLQEKFISAREQLGDYWAKRLIMLKDKTLVRGDYLIDDKPDIRGTMTPAWEHIFYNHPWNANISGKRRITWHNYKEVLPELFL